MRSDMNKVVTERPRRGHANKSAKTSRRLPRIEIHSDMEDYDSGPDKHPISRSKQHGWDAKEFSDLLGPLRRYLHKQVGRPWNSIFSELSTNLDSRTVSGRHIWTHVYSEVERYTTIRNGEVITNRWGGHKVSGFYVHPVHGLLCFTPYLKFRYRGKADPDKRVISPMTELCKEKGIWYLYTYEKRLIDYSYYKGLTKVFLRKLERVLVLKKQLNRKELLSHDVVND